MSLIGLKDVALSFGGPMILDGVDVRIEPGERVGLVGRNGAGKSTLLKVLTSQIEPERGEIMRRQGLRVASLGQEVPPAGDGTVREQLTAALAGADTETWEVERRIDRTTAWLGLDSSADASTLSAGQRRRAMLARAIVLEPDLLILDEPTNHLDIEAITALEEQLLGRTGALVFVTHDRSFLRRLATRILDLDRGRLRSFGCDYETYLARKEAEELAIAEQGAQLDKKLAKEEAWLRRGMKARRARNMGRVRALKAMRETRAERREQVGAVKATLQQAGATGRLVIRAEKISKSFSERVVIRDFTTTIMRGDRVGVIGPNGCGKSTLLGLLLGGTEPDAGSIRHGTNLEIARFDQLHATLDDTKSVQDNVAEGSDKIEIGGAVRHVMGYLKDFLFTPEQIRGSVKKLSGGERNRLQLARILARPCNVLALDEPTNDLDVETLELLESLLLDFTGTLLVVSHDRQFLDNVVTSTLVFEGEGGVKEYVGGYEDWLRQRPQPEPADRPTRSKKASPAPPRPRRLTFKEQRELEALPDRIDDLERRKSELHATMADPAFYRGDGQDIAAAKARLDEIEDELAAALERWELLEGIASAG